MFNNDLVSVLSKGKKTFSPGIIGLVLGAFLIVCSSWLRACFADTLMVDAHALGGSRALLVYLFFCGGLAVYSISFYRFWKEKPIASDKIRVLAYMLTALFSLMLPMLSNDVFVLLRYGDLANKGADIFTQTHFNGLSWFQQFCNPNATDGPLVYGPLCIIFMKAATFFFPQNLVGALIAYKLITLLWAILFIEAGYQIASSSTHLSKAFLFIVLNPLFLCEGVGQQHVDLLAVALALWAVYLVIKNNAAIAFIPIAMAAAVKMSYVLLFPYALISLCLQHNKFGILAIKSLTGLALAIVALGVLYWPFYTSFGNFITPVQSLLSQVPTKSIVEVFGDIIFYAMQLLHPSNKGFSIPNTVAADASITAQKQQIWTILIFICRFVAIGTSLLLVIRFFRGEKSSSSLTSLYLRLLLLFLLFFSHVIYPWYLLMILPFVWFEQNPRFIFWLFALTCFCVAQGIMCSVDRHSWVYGLVVPLIAINVCIFLWRFINNFLLTD